MLRRGDFVTFEPGDKSCLWIITSSPLFVFWTVAGLIWGKLSFSFDFGGEPIWTSPFMMRKLGCMDEQLLRLLFAWIVGCVGTLVLSFLFELSPYETHAKPDRVPRFLERFVGFANVLFVNLESLKSRDCLVYLPSCLYLFWEENFRSSLSIVGVGTTVHSWNLKFIVLSRICSCVGWLGNDMVWLPLSFLDLMAGTGTCVGCIHFYYFEFYASSLPSLPSLI